MDTSKHELNHNRYHAHKCVRCLSIGVLSTLKYKCNDKCVECVMRDAEVKRASLETPFMQGLKTGDSDKDLIACVILCAIHDSKSHFEAISEPAKEWLKDNRVCEFYCGLVGVDHNAMIDRVSDRW